MLACLATTSTEAVDAHAAAVWWPIALPSQYHLRWSVQTLSLTHISLITSPSSSTLSHPVPLEFPTLSLSPPHSLPPFLLLCADVRFFSRIIYPPIGTNDNILSAGLPKTRQKVRHKVLFLDVAHTQREVGGFKTRHLYPPKDLYDNLANRCGAVVVGSCRIGGTNEIDLGMLRKKSAGFWDAFGKSDNRKKKRGAAADSDTASATSSSGNSDGSGSGHRNGSSSEGTVGDTSEDGDDGLVNSDSESHSESDSSGHSGASATGNSSSSSSSSKGGEDSAGSGTGGSSGSQTQQSRDGSADGESLGGDSTSQHGERDDKGERSSRRRKGGRPRPSRVKLSRTISGRTEQRSGGGGGGLMRWSSGVHTRKPFISSGSGGNGGSGGGGGGDGNAALKQNAKKFPRKRERQPEEHGFARACASVSERAIYEDNMSVFGRTVRDALSGECTENVHLPRVLVVDVYSFVRREFLPYGRPRPSAKTIEEGTGVGDGGGGGEREIRARKEEAAAEAAAEKVAAKKKAQRRARMGAKAAKEEDRLEKEAEQLKKAEEEERRRTQVGGWVGGWAGAGALKKYS